MRTAQLLDMLKSLFTYCDVQTNFRCCPTDAEAHDEHSAAAGHAENTIMSRIMQKLLLDRCWST